MHFTDFVALLGAIIPLFIALFGALPALTSMLSNSIRLNQLKSVDLTKPAALKVLQIKRKALDEKDWLKIKRSYFLSFLISLASSIFLLIAVLTPYLFFDTVTFFVRRPAITSIIRFTKEFTIINSTTFQSIIDVAYLIEITLLIFITYTELRSFLNFGDNPQDTRFFLFKELKIKVEADYEELFTYINNALMILKCESLELDLELKEMYAFFRNKKWSKTIIFKIEEQTDGVYVILIKLLKNGKGSRITNQFINIAFLNPDLPNKSDSIGSHNSEQKQFWLARFFKRG